MKRAVLVVGLALLAAAPAASAGQARDKQIQERGLSLGAWWTCETGPAWSPGALTAPLLKRYAKYYPSMAVYRFEVGPGNAMTFETEYAGDGIKGGVVFLGVDPQSPSDSSAPAPEGSTYLIQHIRDFPGRYSLDETYGQRTYVTIAKEVRHHTVWVLFLAAKPAAVFRIRVCDPPCYDKEFVRKSGTYVRVPGKPDRLSFSNVYDVFWLGYRAGDEPKK